MTKQRALVGESAAGLFVVETFLLNPELFERYVAMDPAIYWNRQFLVRVADERLKAMPQTPIRFWFSASSASDITPPNRELASILKKHAPESLTWKFVPRTDLQHHTIFRATKEDAFGWALWPGESSEDVESSTARQP